MIEDLHDFILERLHDFLWRRGCVILFVASLHDFVRGEVA